MQRFLTNSQMRAADNYTINKLGVPSRELMERAGSAIAEQVKKAAEGGKKITVVCGGGNNGGDGYVCARLLVQNKLDVCVYDASSGEYSPDCAAQKAAYNGPFTREISGDIIVDCIFGTGLTRAVEGALAHLIDDINKSGAYIISADIPSGLNGDNGQVLGRAVCADLTVAIGEYKLGHVLGNGPDYCGAVVKADIGIVANGDYAQACDDSDIAAFFPKRPRNSHKGTYGSACLIAGSSEYPGAAALCLSTALRSGCGYVKLCSDERVRNSLAGTYPQAIYLPDPDFASDCLAIGPGCGDSDSLYGLLTGVLRNYRGKLIIDADGLNALAGRGVVSLSGVDCPVLVTPHVREFSRLTGKSVRAVLNDPIGCARAFANEYRAVVLLKSAVSVITDGERVMLNLRGSTSMAKGGSGDMLTGLICGTAARGEDLFDAAVCSSYVLGAAAEIASAVNTDYCATAEDIISGLPQAVKNIIQG